MKDTAMSLLPVGSAIGDGHSEQVFDALDVESAALIIQGLPARYQIVMRMRYLQSLSLTEIAYNTGHTKNAIVTQVLDGLEKLNLVYAPVRS